MVGLGQKVVTLAPTIDTKGNSTNPNSKQPGDFLYGEENLIYVDAKTEGTLKYVKVTYEWEDEHGVTQRKEVFAEEDEYKNWVVNIDTTGIPDGTVIARIEASDTADRITTSTPITYIVKNNPPFINMLIPNVYVNYDKVTQYNTKEFDNNTKPLPSVVMDSYISGVFDDLAGIAPGYPMIKIWKEGSEEPGTHGTTDRNNSGYGDVTSLNKDPNDGWINVDDGLVKSEKGSQAGSFKYFLREHKADGSWYDQGEGKALGVGDYRLKILVKDMTGKTIEWPREAYKWPDGIPDSAKCMKINIIDYDLPPQVTITEPEDMYLRENFTIKAEAKSSGDRYMAEMYVKVEGKKKNSEGKALYVTLKQKLFPTNTILKGEIETGVKIGKTYYVMEENGLLMEIDSESSVPNDAYTYITIAEGQYNFIATALSESGSEGKDLKTIYIDQTPPKAEITRVSPAYSQDSVNMSQMAIDLPAGFTSGKAKPEDYRRWTVNSTVAIDVSTTDNRGNATTDDVNNYIKFKYLLLKDSDIATSEYIKYFDGDKLKEQEFSEYLYNRSDAEFFEKIAGSPIPSSNDNPLIKVTGKDGAYTLTLQTRQYDTKEKYKIWFYVAALDNAGNASFQKILLNVDQDTDIPKITIGNISSNGSTFMDDKYGIRFEVKDDNGLDGASSVKVRFAKNLADRDSLGENGGWFTLPGILSEDKLSMSIDNLRLIEIADRIKNGGSYSGEEKLTDALKEFLGNENDDKYIQIQATDSTYGKIYPTTDGVYTKQTDWTKFRIDLTYPVIVPSKTDNTGKTITRTKENPFVTPEQEGSYTKETDFTAYGDIIEQNIDRIEVKIDGKPSPKNYNVPDPVYSSLTPSGNDFRVWRTKDAGWNGELRFRIPFSYEEFFTPSSPFYLQDGAHTFEITFFDKAGQYVTQVITFYIDTRGPDIDVIIPSGEKITLTDTINIDPATKKKLIDNSIKDVNAKLIGSFNDSYSPVFSSDNKVYWYKRDSSGWTSTEVDDYTSGSKSASWQISIPDNAIDGVYTVSLRVMDSRKNGYNPDKPITTDDTGGYLDNLAYMLDRNIPQFENVTIDSAASGGVAGFTVKGKIKETYSASNFEIKIGEKSKFKIDTVPASGEKEFSFNYWVKADSDFVYGSNNVTVSVTGSSGQSAVKTISFILDNRGPEISFNTTGGQKIKLTTADFNEINTKTQDNWSFINKEALYANRIKDRSSSAKLTGRFSDDYTAIPAANGKYTFQYRIDGPGNVTNGSWKPLEMTAAAADSRSVPWEVPIPASLADGVYRLSVAVKDSKGNGSDGLTIPAAAAEDGNIYGYEADMAFIIDRTAPTLNITATSGTIFGRNANIEFSGSVSGTYAVQSLTMSINGGTPEDKITTLGSASGPKTFAINTNTLNTDALAYGPQNIVFTVTGSSDQTVSKTISFIVDTKGPEVTISGGKSKIFESALGADTTAVLNAGLNDGSKNPRDWSGNLKLIYNDRLKDNSARLTMNIVDEYSYLNTSLQYKINDDTETWKTLTISPSLKDASMDIPWSALVKEGLNKLDIKVSDNLNNVKTEQSIVFMVDRNTPTLEVSDIWANRVYGGNADITVTGVIKNVYDVTRLSLLFNGSELEAKGTEEAQLSSNSSKYLNYAAASEGFPFQFTILKSKLAYGPQSVLVSAIGSSGQSASENFNIIIDTKAPAIEVNVPSGDKIYLQNAAALNSENRAILLANSVKDVNAQLTGSFNDEYSAVFSAANDSYWYKITDINGAIVQDWKYILGNYESINKSATWQVPITDSLKDGVYLLSLRVKDSLLNGKSNTDSTSGNSGDGYINNLAFILDRSVPQLTITDTVNLTKNEAGKTGFYVKGNVTNTYNVNNFDVRVGEKSRGKTGTTTTNGERSFTFNYWVQIDNFGDLEYGSNNVTISVTGSSGQSAVKTLNFIYDNKGPEISFNTTGGQKIVLNDISAISTVNLNNAAWTAQYKEFLYGTRIKDKTSSAKLTGRFSDEYTAIPAANGKYTFRYKIDGPGNVTNGSWTQLEMTSATADSKSVPWEIPIDTNLVDGIYRLSIAVKDRLTNGSDGVTAPLVAGDGYEANMAFMIDREAPELNISGITEGKVFNDAGSFTLTGSVTNTFEVQSFSVSINGETETVTTTPGALKTFGFTSRKIEAKDLAHGRQNIVISATGSSDQIKTVTYGFIVDKEGPIVTINGRSKFKEPADVSNTATINAALNLGSENPRDWTGNLAVIYNERLKDNSAKITLSISDEFSPPSTYQYSINGGTPLTTSVSNLDIPWSTPSINEGLNKLNITVLDLQGNKTEETGIVFMVDRRTPNLSVTLTQNNVVQTGIYSGNTDITVTGTVKNVFDVTRVNLLFNGTEISAKGTEASLPLTYANGGFPFEFTIDTGKLTHGTHSVLINAVGSSGQSAMESSNIIIDSKGPDIKFLTTNEPVYLNDTELITLHNYVNQGIGSLSPDLNAKNTKLAATSIKDISARLIGNFIDDYTFVFNKKGDGSAETEQYGYWYKIDRIENNVIVPGSWDWMEFPFTDGKYESTSASWNIPLQGGLITDGYYRISLRVKDRLGNGFYPSEKGTAASNQSGGGLGYQDNMAFMIERGIPELDVATVPSFISKDHVVTGIITGTTAVSAVNVSMGGNPIASIGNGVTLTGAGAKTFNFSFTIPTANLDPKSYSVMITATGASGQSAQEVRNFTFDKTAPTVGFNAPTVGTVKYEGDLRDNGKYSILWSGSWVTGRVTIAGVADDKNGIDKIYYHIGKLTDNFADGNNDTQRDAAYNAPNIWKDTLLDTDNPENNWKGGVYYWTYTEDLNVYIQNYSSLIERTVDSSQTHTVNMFYLPFYVKVVDRAGNINVAHYKVYVDPDKDIPMASIASPADGVRVGGAVRITGTASDNNWVHSVDIRIKDKDRNSYYKNDEDDWVEGAASGWVKAKIVGNTDTVVSWYYNVNEDDKLNPDPGKAERIVEVEVRAWDTKDALHQITGLVSGPSKAFTYYFDSSIPTISDMKITKSGNVRDYIDGIRVSGNFTFSAVVKDDGGISSIRARRTGGSQTFTEIVRDGAPLSSPGWNVTPPATVPQTSWESGWRYYLITTGTMTQSDWSSIDLEYSSVKIYAPGTMIKFKGGSTNKGATAMKATGTRANTGDGLTNPNSANWNLQYFMYTVEFTIDSTTVANLGYGKTGIFTIELDVYDNNKQPAPYNTRGTYNLGVDNYYPTATITTQYNASTKTFKVMGMASDYDSQSGSILGLERMLVYFEKGGTYYNPRGKKVNETDTFYTSGNPGYTYSGEWATIPAMTTLSNVRDYGNNTTLAGYGPNRTTFTNFPVLKVRAKGGNIGDVWESPHAIVIDSQEVGDTIDTDGDGTNAEYWEGRVDKEWIAMLDTTALPEGPITVHYVIMDQAGNASHYTDEIYIGNNRPLIREITLGTDINADQQIKDNEYAAPISVGDTEENNIEHTTNFRVRNSRFGFNINAVLGNNQKNYRVSYVTGKVLKKSTEMQRGKVYKIATPEETTAATLGNVGAGSTEWKKYGSLSAKSGTVFVASGPARQTASDGYAWEYTDSTATGAYMNGAFASNTDIASNVFTIFTNMPDSSNKQYDANNSMILKHDKLFIVKVYDTTVSGGTEDKQLAHVALINLDFDNTDEWKPKAVINPFYWTSAANNSLYGNSKANGHIELEAQTGSRPKVSGQISIRGTVTDNNVIGSLWACIDNLTLTGAPQTDSIGGITYSRITNYTSNNLVSVDQWSNGWKCTILDSVIDQDGHRVTYQLDIDTSKHANVVASNQVLRVIARDISNNNQTVDTVSTTDAAKTSRYDIDIVPYISKIETKLDKAYNPNPSAFNRSAKGLYPVHEDEEITIQGFNFRVGNTTVSVNGTALPAGNITVTGTSIKAFIDSDTNHTNATNNITSGVLVVRVNNAIDSINNTNSNTAEYNKEGNGLNNDTLTDDRALYVWNTGKISSEDITTFSHPFMRMDNSGTRLLSYGYYTANGTGRLKVQRNNDVIMAGVSYSNRMFNTTVATGGSNASWYAAGSDQSSGDTQNRGFQFGMSTTGGDASTFGLTNTSNANTYALPSNNNYVILVSNLSSSTSNRFKIPRIAVQPTSGATISGGVTTSRGTSNRSNNSADRILISSFDDANKQIRIMYANAGVGTAGNATTAGNSTIGGITNNPGAGNFGSAKIVADDTTTHKGSMYTAVGFMKNGLPVIAWYDRVNQNLVLSWGSKAPTASNNNTNFPYDQANSRVVTETNDWQNNAVIIDTFKGTHVDMAIDDADNVHLAYYDVSNGGLWYALIPPTTGTAANIKPNVTNITPVKVDTYLSAGTKLMLNVRKEGSNYVPYISYAHSSFGETRNSIRVAWRSDFSAPNTPPNGCNEKDSFTGAWEVMTVPVSNNVTPVIDEFVCNGVPTGGTLTAPGGDSALRTYANISKSIFVGYLTDSWYEGAVLKKDLY
jgi:hypothetical protein